MTMRTMFYKNQYIQMRDEGIYVTFSCDNSGLHKTMEFKTLVGAKRRITKFDKLFDEYILKYSIVESFKRALT